MSSRLIARSVQLSIDLAVLATAYVLAFLFRFEFTLNLEVTKLLFFTLPYVVLFQYLVLAFMGVPALAWRYIGLRDTYRIGGAVLIAVGVLVGLRLGLVSLPGHAKFARIPLGILAIDFVLAFLGISGVRVLRRLASEGNLSVAQRRAKTSKRTLLIGAGRAGAMVAREVAAKPDLGIELVGFVDDDPVKIGTLIQGAKVLGDTESLPKLIADNTVEQIIITMGAASSTTIRRIVRICDDAGVPPQIIPGLYEILDGQVILSRIREVTIADLLGREAVELDIDALNEFVRGRCVLVTGAGGSIGSELCRQVANLDPSSLILVEQSENALFDIHRELKRTHPALETAPRICDICDEDRLEDVFVQHKPDLVIHAAAYKHVPMMEWNPGEAIKNNVFGTQRLADTAVRHQVRAFVMISTDKAVNPTSVMGATKRAAELYIQSMSAQHPTTTFVAVRFGNVLGSAGSVVPTFKEQIARGGPVTVTHPDMERYFMTIPEASQLVLQAGAMGKGGEIFVLDMGEPVKILDLARDLIRLSGFTEEEIPITFSGTRPGEKLYEEIAVDSEKMDKTRHPKIYIGKIASHPREAVLRHLAQLQLAGESHDRRKVRAALSDMIPEMRQPDETPPPPKAGVEPRARVLH
ncbi:MAG: nucleoside-diphosphate sugar epimerase/dehydratase [Polyangiaceae bacterium]